MRAQKASVFVEIMEKIRPAQCGAALFGKETSQRGGSCIVSPAVMAAMGSILTNK